MMPLPGVFDTRIPAAALNQPFRGHPSPFPSHDPIDTRDGINYTSSASPDLANRLLIRGLPADASLETLSIVLLLNDCVTRVELVVDPLDPSFRPCALLHYKTMEAALAGKANLETGQVARTLACSLSYDILSESQTRRFVLFSPGPRALSPPDNRRFPDGRDALGPHANDGSASLFATSTELPIPVPIPEGGGHSQSQNQNQNLMEIFSPQSPIGNHLTERGNRPSSKELISGVIGDDQETRDLLKDPVAYAENTASASARRRPNIPPTSADALAMTMGHLSLDLQGPSATAPMPSLPPPTSALSAGLHSHQLGMGGNSQHTSLSQPWGPSFLQMTMAHQHQHQHQQQPLPLNHHAAAASAPGPPHLAMHYQQMPIQQRQTLLQNQASFQQPQGLAQQQQQQQHQMSQHQQQQQQFQMLQQQHPLQFQQHQQQHQVPQQHQGLNHQQGTSQYQIAAQHQMSPQQHQGPNQQQGHGHGHGSANGHGNGHSHGHGHGRGQHHSPPGQGQHWSHQPQLMTGQQTPSPYRYPAVNPADQNPPCNTLYVGNLHIDTTEEELKGVFSKQRGYKRLCFRNKPNGPMCFVEFESVSFATKALHELYGRTLKNRTKGGMRLSFSKNPLGVRSTVPNSAQAPPGSMGPMGMGNGTMTGFVSASGPPPGLTAPPGLMAGRSNFDGPGQSLMNGNGIDVARTSSYDLPMAMMNGNGIMRHHASPDYSGTPISPPGLQGPPFMPTPLSLSSSNTPGALSDQSHDDPGSRAWPFEGAGFPRPL